MAVTYDGLLRANNLGDKEGAVEDLGLIAGLFGTSSKLSLAASSLRRIARGEELRTQTEKDALSWTGQFLYAVDWTTPQKSAPVSGGLAVQATSIRPTFYSCLFRLAAQIRAAGLTEESKLSAFLVNLYRNLSSPGAPGRGYKKLTQQEAELGAAILSEIADSILVQISNNGLPRPSTTLKDEWKPTVHEPTPALAY